MYYHNKNTESQKWADFLRIRLCSITRFLKPKEDKENDDEYFKFTHESTNSGSDD
jgi:hypothetical protein